VPPQEVILLNAHICHPGVLIFVILSKAKDLAVDPKRGLVKGPGPEFILSVSEGSGS
jgi:hypothetical protein